MPRLIVESDAPSYVFCSIFSLRIRNSDSPEVRFFILYAANPPPPTPNIAAAALTVVNMASAADVDAVIPNPAMAAATAGPANPPVTANKAPATDHPHARYLESTCDTFASK